MSTEFCKERLENFLYYEQFFCLFNSTAENRFPNNSLFTCKIDSSTIFWSGNFDINVQIVALSVTMPICYISNFLLSIVKLEVDMQGRKIPISASYFLLRCFTVVL